MADFERLRRVAPAVINGIQDLRFPCEDLSVGYCCDTTRGLVEHVQVFRAGRLSSWQFNRVSNVDLCIRQDASVNLNMLTRQHLGNHLIASTRKLVGDGGWRAIPPMDAVVTGWGRSLPRYPGAGRFLVQQVLYSTPLGDLASWFESDGGPIVASGTGVRSEADITIQRRYALAMKERLGLIDALESLEGGQITGDQGCLMFFLGIWDTPECVEARRALATPQDEALGILGDVLSSESWETVADRLRSTLSIEVAGE